MATHRKGSIVILPKPQPQPHRAQGAFRRGPGSCLSPLSPAPPIMPTVLFLLSPSPSASPLTLSFLIEVTVKAGHESKLKPGWEQSSKEIPKWMGQEQGASQPRWGGPSPAQDPTLHSGSTSGVHRPLWAGRCLPCRCPCRGAQGETGLSSPHPRLSSGRCRNAGGLAGGTRVASWRASPFSCSQYISPKTWHYFKWKPRPVLALTLMAVQGGGEAGGLRGRRDLVLKPGATAVSAGLSGGGRVGSQRLFLHR